MVVQLCGWCGCVAVVMASWPGGVIRTVVHEAVACWRAGVVRLVYGVVSFHECVVVVWRGID